MVSCISHCN